ncbi:hypothetical protein TWF506_006548 [Arthrobotrys conoides]|uniref:Uncharacterized protein n=1 Tax=Arthrobotrys conoides TaxID=74498 RepID=A0AAN8NRX8_9PEZI
MERAQLQVSGLPYVISAPGYVYDTSWKNPGSSFPSFHLPSFSFLHPEVSAINSMYTIPGIISIVTTGRIGGRRTRIHALDPVRFEKTQNPHKNENSKKEKKKKKKKTDL